jgi:WD40 repeat protein
MREQLRDAARQWDERGRARGLLWRDEALAEYRIWRRRYGSGLSAVETAFADASLELERRARRRLRSLVAGAFVILASLLAVLVRANHRAEIATAETRARLMDSYVEQARVKLQSGRQWEALVDLISAQSLGAHGPMIDVLRGLAREPARLMLWRAQVNNGSTWNARFSPNGRFLVTNGQDGAALWDATTGVLRARLVGHDGHVEDAAWRADGKQVATIGFDKTARIWDVPSGTQTRILTGHEVPLRCIAWHKDGRWLATGDEDGYVRIWDLAQGTSILNQMVGPFVSSCVFGPRRVAVGTFGGQVALIDPETHKMQLLGKHRDLVRAVMFSHAGDRVASISDDRTMRVWNATTGALITELRGASDRLQSGAFSPDDKEIVASARDGSTRVWDVASGRMRLALTGHRGVVWHTEFDPSGRRILTTADDGSARLWNRSDGLLLAAFEGHANLVRSGHFSPDGKTVVTASEDGSIALWRAEGSYNLFDAEAGVPGQVCGDSMNNGSLILSSCNEASPLWDLASRRQLLNLGAASTLALRDNVALTVDMDNLVARLWQLPTGRPIRVVRSKIALSAVAASAEAYALADEEGKVRVFDTKTGSLRFQVAGQERGATLLAFLDENRWVSVSLGGTVRLFDRDRELAQFEGPPQPTIAPNALSVSPARDVLVMVGQKDLLVLRLDGTPRLQRLKGHQAPVTTARFDPTGAHLVTTSQDGTGAIWDVAKGTMLHRLRGSSQYLADAVFDPTGKIVISGDGDGALSFFDVDSARLLGQVEGERDPARALTMRHDGTLAVLTATGNLTEWRIPTDRDPLDVVRREITLKAPEHVRAALSLP